jgi:hypothetical protein
MFLIANSTSAFAEWNQLEVNSKEGIYTYADPATIQVNGQKVKMWTLLDRDTSDTFAGKLFKSAKAYEEYDCAVGKSRVLWLTYSSGHLGGGEIIWSQSVSAVSKWEQLSLDTSTPRLYEFACAAAKQNNIIPTQITNENIITKTISIEEAKSKCTDLGFKAKTEAFGKCVLKLSN